MFSKLRAAAVIPALFAGYLGLATSAHAQFCPPALLPGQQDGVCVTNRTDTRTLFQTSSEVATNEFFIAMAGVPLVPDFNEGVLFLLEPSGSGGAEAGLPGLLPGIAPTSGL